MNATTTASPDLHTQDLYSPPEFLETVEERRFLTGYCIYAAIYFVSAFLISHLIDFSSMDEFQVLLIPPLFYIAIHYSRGAYLAATVIAFLTACFYDIAVFETPMDSISTVSWITVGLIAAQEVIYRNAETQRKLRFENERLNEKLKQNLERVKRLSEILPICGVCSKLRTDEQTWREFERFLSEELKAELVHGVCTHCLQEMLDDIQGDDALSASESDDDFPERNR